MSAFETMAASLSGNKQSARGDRLRMMRERVRAKGSVNGRELSKLAGVPTNYVRAMLGRDIEAGRIRVTPRRGGLPSIYEWTGHTVESPRVKACIEWLEQLGYKVTKEAA